MGIIADIYKRSGSNCSNDGISNNYDKVLVVNVDGPFKAGTDNLPLVKLVRGNIAGTCKAVEVDEYGGVVDQCPMFGGCFIYTSDSRFSDKVREITGGKDGSPVPLHDRVEYIGM